jgi:hypothetical protein
MKARQGIAETGLANRTRSRELLSMPEEAPKGWRHERRHESKKPPVHVRFTADTGEVWTVWDTTFSKFKNHRHAHCDLSAKARVFVNAAGVKRSYDFKRNESRVLDAAELERQLREASFVGAMPELRKRTPR